MNIFMDRTQQFIERTNWKKIRSGRIPIFCNSTMEPDSQQKFVEREEKAR